MKPFLRYAGSKARLLSELVARLPEDWRYRTYTEPFLGSGALFFHLQPKRAVLGDANEDLITTYQSIRDAHEKTERSLAHYAVCNTKGQYEEIRRRFNLHQPSHRESTRAAQFIYLNRTCFNGLWRVNRRGEFNVSYGHLKNPTIAMGLYHHAIALRGARLISKPFDYTLDRCAGGSSFVYADPPYDGDTHQSYTAEGFGRAEQNQLALELKHVARVGAKVMVSNSDTPFIRALYADWYIHEVEVRRSISANGARPKAKELIITSYYPVGG